MQETLKYMALHSQGQGKGLGFGFYEKQPLWVHGVAVLVRVYDLPGALGLKRVKGMLSEHGQLFTSTDRFRRKMDARARQRNARGGSAQPA